MVLMTKEDWKDIKHFSPNENWGDWTKIAKELIFALDALRDYMGIPIYINCGYATSGHSPNSYHYKGMAVDVHCSLSALDFFLKAERFNKFNGIGIYPDWYKPGLHLDIRPKENNFDYDARWLGVKSNSGKQMYIGLTAENIYNRCFKDK